MNFVDEWMSIALAIAFVCGGLVIGRKIGGIGAFWLTGATWFAFRLTDSMWKAAVIEVRAGNPGLDLVTWIPVTYGLVFAAVWAPMVMVILIAQPKREVELPGTSDAWVGMVGGFFAGAILMLALLQAYVMHPVVKKQMPFTIEATAGLLSALGQEHRGQQVEPGQNRPTPKDATGKVVPKP